MAVGVLTDMGFVKDVVHELEIMHFANARRLLLKFTLRANCVRVRCAAGVLLECSSGVAHGETEGENVYVGWVEPRIHLH